MRVVCDCTVGYNGERYPKGEPCDLPDAVVASLGGRARPVLEEALAPIQGLPTPPPGDPTVAESIPGGHEPLVVDTAAEYAEVRAKTAPKTKR